MLTSTPSTISPTLLPTTLPFIQQPTPEPILQVAPQPTPRPTELFIPKYTTQPTLQPTREPTGKTTPQQPTPQPSQQPTSQPSRQPTLQPTRQPTPEPTRQPTPQPTRQPTPQPTRQPTPQPTRQPTRQPTPNPTPTITNNNNNNNNEDDEEILDVLIVGGGWSGVAALRYLVLQGLNNVRLLEARDYLGGRSRTLNDVFDVKGLSTELGSAWVFPSTEIQDMLEDMDVNYGVIDYTDWSYLGLYADGNFNSDDDTLAWEDNGNNNNNGRGNSKLSEDEKEYLLEEEWENTFVPFSEDRAEEIYENDKEDVPYTTVLEEYWQYWDIPEGNRHRSFINAMSHAQLSLEYAAPLSLLSTKVVGEAVNNCIFCGAPHYMSVMGGGFDKLIRGLVEPVRTNTNVQLQSRVSQIDYSNNDGLVRVTYNNREGEERILRARTVLVTVPLGVLKASDNDDYTDFRFVPQLPRWKRRAISSVGFGILNKCILYWDTPQRRWWPENEAVVTLLTDEDDDAGFWTTYFNDRELGNGGHYILTGWIGGDSARWSEDNQSNEQILQTVLRNLRRMFGGQVPEPTSYIITKWGQDPYALGSYSFAKSSTRDDLDDLREQLFEPVADRRIYFSGEATDDFYGTAVGAYRSGRRAARLIIDQLQQ